MSLVYDAHRRVHVRAPGKLNLFFEVGDAGDDGYHEVASLYQAVSLYEDVWATHGDDFTIGVSGDVDVSTVPLDGRNLAVRAAQLVTRAADWDGGIHLDIHKGVPVAGGMGGGSADAAAALVAVNELIGAGLSSAELQELGAQLGADVPFALLGGTAVGTGRGDELAPALARGRFDWVLVRSDGGLSTPDVYRELDRLRAEADITPDRAAPAVDPAVLRALRSGDAADLGAAIRNDLELAATTLMPSLSGVLAAGIREGALGALVSGSGPTVALLAQDDEAGRSLAARLGDAGLHAVHVHGPVPGARLV
ncbi:4-(cytidine 5'-diphospho)-2-C-methyl-D-erythritol kinase [Microbacterium sp. LX3-4]|uniref:4-diphosphocytidyl-2-C-methyl-D-erythritol kinase n=1 Tax=Microbacterium dauci TaxID=3048008 RepID=A0ABT6ZB04_9MICO|nr:4-(cytidine 5'-diphospho)-2-C-methyl-D-erythritol kinase [Microbacterium sp. LX3-4]